MQTLIKTTALAVGLCFGMGAHASTIEYDVTGITKDSGAVLGLWIKTGLDSGSADIYGIYEPGNLTIEMDGTATFNAKTRDAADLSTGFDLSFQLDDNFTYVDPNDPLAAPFPKFKSLFGAVEHGNEFYLEMRSGTMTGVGALAGLDMNVSLLPTDGEFVFQAGGGLLPGQRGANQHTDDLGMSGWFEIVSVTSATCASCGDIAADNSIVVGTQADVNVNLQPSGNSNVSPVPLPAGALLLLTGLGAFGAIRSRRN